jgi:hypothetical protein
MGKSGTNTYSMCGNNRIVSRGQWNTVIISLLITLSQQPLPKEALFITSGFKPRKAVPSDLCHADDSSETSKRMPLHFLHPGDLFLHSVFSKSSPSTLE